MSGPIPLSREQQTFIHKTIPDLTDALNRVAAVMEANLADRQKVRVAVEPKFKSSRLKIMAAQLTGKNIDVAEEHMKKHGFTPIETKTVIGAASTNKTMSWATDIVQNALFDVLLESVREGRRPTTDIDF